MNVRKRKKYIWLSAAALSGVTLMLLVWGICSPIEIDVEKKSDASAQKLSPLSAAASSKGQARKQYSIAELQRMCNKQLRLSLFPSPEELKPKIHSASTLPLKIALIGTIIEDDHSMAMFKCSDNSIEISSEGESFKSSGKTVKVIRIDASKVKILCLGKTYELKIPQQDQSFNYFATAPAGG